MMTILRSVPNQLKLGDGTEVTFRVIQPEDADIEQAFVKSLSTESRYSRFFSASKQLSPVMLLQFTHPNFPDTYALIATVIENGKENEIGVARYAAINDEGDAEFAVVVADAWQRQGIASHLLEGVTATASTAGFMKLEGLVLKDNRAMLGLASKQGFVRSSVEDDPSVVRVVKDLRS